MKQSPTGGRLMNLLNQNGYMANDPTGRARGVILLSKLVKDGVTGNQFLGWTALQRYGGARERALETDLCDLNEKLIEFGFPPLRYEIKSDSALKKAIQLVSEFGRKIIGRI
jgi:hypothetical protein